MFERRNQSILTPHYSALVSHDDDEDEVFTLARKDHALADEGNDLADGDLEPSAAASEPLISSEDLSKRKLKAGVSKKAILKNRPAAEKLVFDEEGNATNFYESGRQAELGAGDVAARKEFLEKERAQMREADKVDRAVAREAKREKKRKRKEREKEVSATCGRLGRWESTLTSSLLELNKLSSTQSTVKVWRSLVDGPTSRTAVLMTMMMRNPHR